MKREGESRKKRVARNAAELAAEAGISFEDARVRLRSGNPSGKVKRIKAKINTVLALRKRLRRVGS